MPIFGEFYASLVARLEVQLERFSLVGEKGKNLYLDQVSFIILSAEVGYNIDKKGQFSTNFSR